MDWFFRGLFKTRRPGSSFDNDNVDNEDAADDFGMKDPFSFPFINPFDQMEDSPQDVFQRMDEILNRVFFSSDTSFGQEYCNDQIQEETDPRSVMLKDPEHKKHGPYNVLPFQGRDSSTWVDSDIDDTVAKNRWILGENPSMRDQSNVLCKRFSSVKTVRMADGTLEEHRTVADGAGNTTTTVRRSIGDQIHEVTTQSDKSGLKEKLENFTNLDEKDLVEFDRRWQNIRSGNKNAIPDLDVPKTLERIPNVPEGDSSYLALFKKFFGY